VSGTDRACVGGVCTRIGAVLIWGYISLECRGVHERSAGLGGQSVRQLSDRYRAGPSDAHMAPTLDDCGNTDGGTKPVFEDGSAHARAMTCYAYLVWDALL